MDHDEHLAHHDAQLALLTSLLERQQEMQAQVLTLADRLADRQDQQAVRQDDHAARMARLEDIAGRIQLTLDAVLEMLRHRNGH